MTAQEAKQGAIQARLNQIQNEVLKYVDQGLFEMRIEKLTPEQTQYLQDNGFRVREIIQKGGSTWDINWEQ